jgi:hypothetical protein
MRCSAVKRARRHDAPKCSLSVPGGSICSDSLVGVVAAMLLPVALLLMTVSTASGDFARWNGIPDLNAPNRDAHGRRR